MDVSAWDLLSSEPKEPVGVLNDKIVMRFDRYINWDLLSKHYDFSIDLLRIYFHRVNWSILVQRRQFSEDVLREFSSQFSPECWSIISEKQILSESFIHDFADRVDWVNIALYQPVTGRFLSDHVNFTPQIQKKDDYILVFFNNE
jgi:hypothetical protein